jgi:hypothetical protein
MRVVGGCVGVVLLVLYLVFLRNSGLGARISRDWFEVVVIAPFLVLGMVILVLRNRRRR